MSTSIQSFRLEQRLHREANGDSIFLASALERGEEAVVLKIRQGKDALNADAIERFQREYFSLSSISSPFVLRAEDFIRDAETLAFSMEYASGGSLAKYLRDSPMSSIDRATTILTQLAHGVLAIHQEGIIHAQLEPKNIYFAADGTVRIAEFGGSLLQDPMTSNHVGTRLGSPAYGSPEYFKTGEVSGQLDLYSLGLIAYELLTGAEAFRSNNPLEKIEMRLETDVPSVSIARPDTPAWLARIVDSCTKRDPRDRIASAAELVANLEAKGEGDPLVSASGTMFARMVKRFRTFSKPNPATVKNFAFVSSSGGSVYVHSNKSNTALRTPK